MLRFDRTDVIGDYWRSGRSPATMPRGPASSMGGGVDLVVEEVPEQRRARVLAQLPRRLYADDPMHVPVPAVWQHSRLDPRGGFFRDAELVVFSARRGGELVGTISVLRDRHFDRDPEARVAWFGHFECIEDATVGSLLLETAEARARSWGAHSLRGGRDLTRFEFVGITVEGFDRLPPMLQGQHRRHYPRMLEARGYRKHHDILAFERDLWLEDGSPAPLPDSLAAKSAACKLPGLVIRRLRYRSMESDLRAAHAVLNEAYATVPDIQPMPLATFMTMGRAIAMLSKRDLIQLAFLDGRPVAFTMCMPEVNEALVHGDGGVFTLGGLRTLMAWRHIRTAAFKLIGVVPHLRGSGLHARMIVEVVHSARRAGFTRVDGSVIDERNRPMRGVVEGAGMHVYRRYRLFERELR